MEIINTLLESAQPLCNVKNDIGTNCVRLSQTSSVCHIQCVSVTYNMCLSQTVCVCHRQSVFVAENLCPSQTVCLCHRQFLSVTDFLFSVRERIWLSQIVCVSHRKFLSFSLSFYQTLFLIILCLNFTYLYLRFQFVQDFGTNKTNFVDPWKQGPQTYKT